MPPFHRRLALVHLRTLLGAVVAVVLTHAVAEATGWRWRNTSDREQGFAILGVYEEEARAPDVVLLGSSLTRWSVLARALEEGLAQRLGRPVEVWNLGLHGATAPQLDEIARRVFDRHAPRLILLETHPAFWNEGRSDDSVLHYWRWFAPLDTTLLGAASRPWEQTEEGLVRILGGARAIWRQGEFLIDPGLGERWESSVALARTARGSFWTEETVRAALQRGEVVDEALWARALALREQRAALVGNFTSGDAWRPILERLVDRCAEAGSELVLFNPPIRTELLESYPGGMKRAHLDWMQEVVGVEAPLLDFDERLTLGRAHYFHLDHLSALGAEAVTRALIEDLAPLLD